MAEETNVALSNPTISGTEIERSQKDNRGEDIDVMDEGISEPSKEGAEKQEATQGKHNVKRPRFKIRMMY